MPTRNEPKRNKLCFVVGPIGGGGSDIRKHSDMILHAVIRPSIDDCSTKYEVRRADDDVRPGMIGDRIIHDIINSDLVIADLTNLNPNVFYELGIRHATSKPTIHIAKVGTHLPFDNSGHDTLFVDVTDWHDIIRTRSKLTQSIEAISAADYQVSNPITQANASFALKSSSDPKDVALAEIMDRLSAIENKQLAGPWKQNSMVAPALADYDIFNKVIHPLSDLLRNADSDQSKSSLIRKFANNAGLKVRNIEFAEDRVTFSLGKYSIFIRPEAGEAGYSLDDPSIP